VGRCLKILFWLGVAVSLLGGVDPLWIDAVLVPDSGLMRAEIRRDDMRPLTADIVAALVAILVLTAGLVFAVGLPYVRTVIRAAGDARVASQE
jgi:hypothetical protein